MKDLSYNPSSFGQLISLFATAKLIMKHLNFQ